MGFGILGYCPGTTMGAVGQGSLDALLGGIPGMLLGAGVYAAIYPRLRDGVLKKGSFGDRTIPEMLGLKPAIGVTLAFIIIIGFLFALEKMGY